MSDPRPLTLLLLLTGCVTAGLRQEDRAHWRRLESARLTLTTSLDDVEARKAFALLENDVVAILAIFGERQTPVRPVDVVVVASAYEFDTRLSGTSEVKAAGFVIRFPGDPAHPILVLGPPSTWLATNPRGESSLARHELTHVVSAHLFPYQPPWLGEGIATWLEPLEHEPGLVVFGGGNRSKLALLLPRVPERGKQPDPRPIVELWSASRMFGATATGVGFYPSVWLLVHYLANERAEAWRRFLEEVASEHGQFDEAFGHLTAAVELASLDANLARYLHDGRFVTGRVAVEPASEPRTVELGAATWDLVRGRLLLRARNDAAAGEALEHGLTLAPADESLRLQKISTMKASALPAFVDDWVKVAPTSQTARYLRRALHAEAMTGAAQDLGAEACESLAQLLIEYVGSFDAGLRFLEEALPGSHARYNLLDSKAWALAALGRWEAAAETEREVVRRAHVAGQGAFFDQRLAAILRHELP